MSDPVLLEARGLVKTYPGGGQPLRVLDGVDLRLGAGEIVAVVGPSGSGKSTLLHLLGTLDRPDAGTLRLDGEDLLAQPPQGLAALRAGKIGFVFQLHHLLPQCSALENVQVPALAPGAPVRPADGAAERARILLERLGLGGRLHHRPGQLSGGERQRVAVARALVNRPRVLLADEPTGSLDREAAGELADLLVELNAEEGTALVLATHSGELAARAERAGRVLELKGGRLSAAGQP